MKAERQQKEATSRVLQQSKGGKVSIVDNRPLSALQAQIINATQRKVAIAQNNKEDEDDWVILTNLAYAKSLVDGTVTDLGANSNFSDMRQSESLAIVGHGEAGKIQGFDATQIAHALTREGRAMPKTTPYIILLSCNAAKPQEGQGIDSSLVSSLAYILRRQYGYDTIVEGKPSYTQVSPRTGINATVPGKETEHMNIEEPLIAKHKLCFQEPPVELSEERIQWFKKNFPEVDIDAMDKKTLRDYLSENHMLKLVSELMEEENVPNWQTMDVEQRAEWIVHRTEGLYIELEHQAKAAGTLFKSGRGPGSGTMLAYGAATLLL